MEIKEYKCPNCGGAVKFDSTIQNMKCPYCDAEFEISALDDYNKELALAKEDSFDCEEKSWEPLLQDDLSTGSCPSCGAELIGDSNTIATVCPCCGNTQIVTKRLTGVLKPDCVIPFHLEKKAAVDALKEFCKGKKLLPNFFVKENHINCIQGVYVPFWLYDSQTDGHVRYKATRMKAWSDSQYNYTKTDFFSVIRDGTLGFEKVPVDASERMDDKYMDAMEPFDYSKIKDFKSAFLSGYLAEKYDVDSKQCMERAAKRMKTSVENEFRKSVTGYSSVSVESSTVNVKDGKVTYSLFPVWILNTKYKKENYQFMMNGQSGRLVGRLPVDNGKAWKYTILYSGIIGAVLTAILQALRIFL
ncbi:MAG: hypothetical protein FWD26_11145 [Treponema sp.]|nr:hypothetical protein [Treponema sp.]